MSNPLDGRITMDSYDGLLSTTQLGVESMIDGSISERQTDIILKAVSTARGVLEVKRKSASSSDKNPVTRKEIELDSSGPFGVFGVVAGGKNE